MLFNHFSNLFGQSASRTNTLNWEAVGLVRHDLEHLEEDFLEEEVHGVVTDITNKAPGPDGYIGFFFFSNAAGRQLRMI